MKHNLKIANEELKRAKLLMKYDSSKTLTENKEVINEIIPLIAAAAWPDKKKGNKLKELCSICSKTDPQSRNLKRITLNDQRRQEVVNLFRKSFDWTLFGLGIGQGTGMNDLRSALKILKEEGNFGDFCKIREKFGKNTEFEDEIISELNKTELVEVTNVIEMLITKSQSGNIKTRDAETANTEWWITQFPCLEVTDSFHIPIHVNTDSYGNTYVKVKFIVKGKETDFHILQNGRIYTADKHKWTGKKITCTGSENTKVTVSESVKKKVLMEQADLGNIDLGELTTDIGGGGGGGTTPVPPTPTKYVECKDFHKMWCMSDAIKKVQECSGGKLVADRKWGKNTQAVLAKIGYGQGFYDKDIETICNKLGGGSGGGNQGGGNQGGGSTTQGITPQPGGGVKTDTLDPSEYE